MQGLKDIIDLSFIFILRFCTIKLTIITISFINYLLSQIYTNIQINSNNILNKIHGTRKNQNKTAKNPKKSEEKSFI